MKAVWRGYFHLADVRSENVAQAHPLAPMFLTHYPPPPIVVPKKTNAADTAAAIEAAFLPFGAPPASTLLVISQGDLALTLMADARWCFSHFAAYGWVSSVTDLDGSNQLRVVAGYKDLPTHWKSVVSQTTAVAANLASAAALGYDYFATLREIELICAALGGPPICGTRWVGFGPDYLVINSATQETALIESKGVSAKMTNTPPKFVEQKVQSCNGWAVGLKAHYLAYTYLEPGLPLTTRFFNNRPPKKPGAQPRALLILAVLQFINQLNRAGHVHWASLLHRGLTNSPPRGDVLAEAWVHLWEMETAYEMRAGFIISIIRRSFTVALRERTLLFFRRVSMNHDWVEDVDVANALAREVHEISRDRGAAHEELRLIEGLHEVYAVSSTGIALVSLC